MVFRESFACTQNHTSYINKFCGQRQNLLILQQVTHIAITVLQMVNILYTNICMLQSLGNHEFDDGVDGLVPFINNATFPILASNLDLSKEKRLDIPNLKKSVVFDLGGVKVAVVGYVTPETKVRYYRVTKN